MAWLDDKCWVHRKVTDLSNAAFRVWVTGILYSSGEGRGGVLTGAQQKMVGATPSIRRELIEWELWEERPKKSIYIHDWDEHNGKRDARRASDRERKRLERAGKYGKPPERPPDSPQDTPSDSPEDSPQEVPQVVLTMTGDGVTVEGTSKALANGSSSSAADFAENLPITLQRLLKTAGANDEGAIRGIAKDAAGLPEASIAKVTESLMLAVPRPDNPIGYVRKALQSERAERSRA